jgi:predicted P-loop ATPase/GTPase
MPTRVVETPADRDMLVKFIEGQKLPVTVEITSGKHRTTQQNRLQRQWANDLAEQKPESSAEEWRGYCKLHFGVPILRADNEAFAAVYDEVIRPLPYEAKLKVMMVPIDLPVTSKMTTKQKKSYLDAIQKFAAENGVQLTDPEAMKWK